MAAPFGRGAPSDDEMDPSAPFFRGMPGRGQQGQPRQPFRGQGSGFIVSADGLIMTNAHVVDGADEVLVTLTDKREFKARIVGADRRTDVAVVKVNATKDLPAASFGRQTTLTSLHFGTPGARQPVEVLQVQKGLHVVVDALGWAMPFVTLCAPGWSAGSPAS